MYLTAELSIQYPESLENESSRVAQELEALLADYNFDYERELATKILTFSPYMRQWLFNHPDYLKRCLTGNDWPAQKPKAQLVDELTALCPGNMDETGFMKAIREFRNAEMIRIGWHDILGTTSLKQTLLSLTDLADTCADHALTYADNQLQLRHGTPRNDQAVPQKLSVIGMGKLGAYELNYSSDIDLIFVYAEAGQTDGKKPLDNSEYFRRVIQKFIHLLNTPTEHGFAFRVDARLRPFGDSGPLVMTFDQMENYYAIHGREWERYAMIKARIIAGDLENGKALLNDLKPFVYRRYIDYDALDSLRDMKSMIAAQVKKKKLEHNIKLGLGGIREVEFIAQTFQLIRGGRERELRTQSLYTVYDYLKTSELMDEAEVDALLSCYELLRVVENRLQQIGDEQTHNLPQKYDEQVRLTLGCGYLSWDELSADIQSARNKVHDIFEHIIEVKEKSKNQAAIDLLECESKEAFNEKLTSAGIASEDNEGVAKLFAFIQALNKRPVGERGQKRLTEIFTSVIEYIEKCQDQIETLMRVVEVLTAICRRTAYLTLLKENPIALNHMLRICEASRWATKYIANHPILLDELIDAESLFHLGDKADLEEQFEIALSHIVKSDPEALLNLIREFKQSQTVRISTSDILINLPLTRVSDHLTDLAEVILQYTVKLAWELLTEKHGIPQCKDENGELYQAEFSVVGYGKLGGIELGYSSDLDLVFLHDSAGPYQQTNGEKYIDNAVFFIKLGQKVMTLLNTTTASGIGYEIDMRLRPNGNSGPLVSSLAAFEKYQGEKAWTWEHQALVRARHITGATCMAEGFETIRRKILSKQKDTAQLRKDVAEMRQRMRGELDKSRKDSFDIKQGAGGIADIEFIAQFGVLSAANQFPDLLTYTDNIRIFDAMARNKLLTPEESEQLKNAYTSYREIMHKRALQGLSSVVDADQTAEISADVQRIWERIMQI